MMVQNGRAGSARQGFPAARTKGERRGGGFGGNRTATRPGSAGRQRGEGLKVGSLSLSLSFGHSDTAPSLRTLIAAESKHRRASHDPTKGRSRPRRPTAEQMAREPVRPVTPVLEVARPPPGVVRGSGQAFPLPRSSWNAKMSRPSSAEGASRRSSRMEPDTILYLRSSDWEPSQHPPEPEPELPSCVRATGRVYVAASVEAQRAHDLAKIQAKYSGGSSEQTGAGLAAPESPHAGGQQQLLCARHRELAADLKADGGANGRTRSMGFLFCGDCFALQAARKQEQAEEERQMQKQQLMSGKDDTSMAESNVTRLAAEMRFGKSNSERMLGSNNRDVEYTPSPDRRSSTTQPALGLERGQAGSAERDQVHRYHFR